MRDVCGGEIVGVHLLRERVDGRVNEERRVSSAGAAPDDVQWRIVVQRCCFGNNAGAFGRGGEVCAEGVEALRGRG